MEEYTHKKTLLDKIEEKPVKYLLIGIFIILSLIILFGSFYIINAGERAVLVTLGNPSEYTISEGLHFKIPILQKVIKFDIKTQKDEVEISSASRDLQTVSANIAVNYHINSDSVSTIYTEIGLNYINRVLSPAVQESTKAATARYTAEELITKREEVRESIKRLLQEKVEDRGIIVEDVLITNFDFSDAFNSAIESKQVAEQNALAAKNKLEQARYEAEQTVVTAKAQAEAIQIQTAAINSQGGTDYVQLQAINKWNGIMPTVTSGAIPFINMNTLVE